MMVVGECETYSFAQMTRALQYENNGAKALGTDHDGWESMWVKVNLMHEFKSTFLNTWFLVWTKYCLSIYSRQMINEAKIVPSELKLITITCALWVLALMATARRDRTHCTLTTHRRSSALFSGRCIPMHVGEAQCIRSLYVCARIARVQWIRMCMHGWMLSCLHSDVWELNTVECLCGRQKPEKVINSTLGKV